MPTVRKKREAEEKSPSRKRTSSLVDSHKGARKCTSCNLQDGERNLEKKERKKKSRHVRKELGPKKAALLLDSKESEAQAQKILTHC